MSQTPDFESSLLLRRMAEAIAKHRPERGTLRVSVAREPKWEKRSPGTDEAVFVRWLCWSIEEGGREVVPPEFEVLHPSVTDERLRRELPGFFPSLEVVVDNDIEV